MQRLLLALSFLFAVMFLPGCMVTTTSRVRVYDPPPGYVYTYPDGGCWADGVWYAWCPWSPGPTYGYYAYDGGIYVLRPHYSWGYRPGYPPPPHWRHYRPAPPYHPAPPPYHRPPHRF
ncbi:MAG TPA: hypothetical protein VL426_06115 [Candidatus Binatia bacterium]|jgi:hypothetical protein|nr:hypothetical protein [Candidatus Binatia bacterium]